MYTCVVVVCKWSRHTHLQNLSDNFTPKYHTQISGRIKIPFHTKNANQFRPTTLMHTLVTS